MNQILAARLRPPLNHDLHAIDATRRVAVFDLRTDHDHDRREDRSPEQISRRALLLGHGLDEQHERRDEEQHDLELALVREPVVAVLDVCGKCINVLLAARLRNRVLDHGFHAIDATPARRHGGAGTGSRASRRCPRCRG